MLNLKVTIAARLFDHRGQLIRKYRPRAAHSFLAQFIEILKCQFSHTTTYGTDTSEVEQALAPDYYLFRVQAAASDLTYGILIGSGTNPVDIDDFKLQTPISANLSVSGHTFVLSYPTPTTRRVTASRTFTNALASPMPIEEVALYTSDYLAHLFCIDRTLYSVAIPASSSLELTYRITVSV